MDRAPHGTAVLVPAVVFDDAGDLRLARAGWLAAYEGGTRRNYAGHIDAWFRWLSEHQVHPWQVKRPHVELWGHELSAAGLMDSSVAKKMGAVRSFYKYAFLEGYIAMDPTAHVRMPKVDDEVSRPYMDRMELGRFVATAEGFSPRDHALAVFLAFTGLRISAALSANIESISQERGHHTIVVRSKNRKIVTVPLVPRVMRALMLHIGERAEGPLFLGEQGDRLDRNVAYRRMRRIAQKAGINKRIGCHSVRRSFITDALDAGVPLRDVQHSVHHKDPRTTARYDQNRRSLDSHAGYVLAAFVGGG